MAKGCQFSRGSRYAFDITSCERRGEGVQWRKALTTCEVPKQGRAYCVTTCRRFARQGRRRGLRREAAAVVTQVLVDGEDAAFRDPTKPIGSPMDEVTARKRVTELGWRVKEDPGYAWRRVVPSPRPQAIVDLDVIAHLVSADYVVIACGGGGIPVVEEAQGGIRGIEAVIDKDFASSLLARELGADRLLVATGVERVALDFGKPTQRWLDRLTLNEAKRLYDQDQFDKGSMGPKICAVIEYLEGGGEEGIITDPLHLNPALSGKGGTRIVRR